MEPHRPSHRLGADLLYVGRFFRGRSHAFGGERVEQRSNEERIPARGTKQTVDRVDVRLAKELGRVGAVETGDVEDAKIRTVHRRS